MNQAETLGAERSKEAKSRVRQLRGRGGNFCSQKVPPPSCGLIHLRAGTRRAASSPLPALSPLLDLTILSLPQLKLIDPFYIVRFSGSWKLYTGIFQLCWGRLALLGQLYFILFYSMDKSTFIKPLGIDGHLLCF